MRWNLSLNTPNGIDTIIKKLEDYEKDLTDKCVSLVNRLQDIGIQTAYANTGQYAGMILFYKSLTPTENGADGLLIGTDSQKIVREWRYNGGIKSAVVSPLLMSEFGSGWFAEVLDVIPGVGQGTFPGQTHAFDSQGWFWTDTDGNKHHSMGEEPTHPMHNAYIEMLAEIDSVASEVFNG